MNMVVTDSAVINKAYLVANPNNLAGGREPSSYNDCTNADHVRYLRERIARSALPQQSPSEASVVAVVGKKTGQVRLLTKLPNAIFIGRSHLHPSVVPHARGCISHCTWTSKLPAGRCILAESYPACSRRGDPGNIGSGTPGLGPRWVRLIHSAGGACDADRDSHRHYRHEDRAWTTAWTASRRWARRSASSTCSRVRSLPGSRFRANISMNEDPLEIPRRSSGAG